MITTLKHDRIWTVPNLLTVLRLCFVVPLVLCLEQGERLWAGFWGFLAVGTDLLDGLIARWLNQKSEIGRLLDPVVDKLGALAVFAYLALSNRYDFPLWFFLFMLGREAAVLAFGLVLVRTSAKVTESNKPGKWSAFTVGTAGLFYVLGWQPFGVVFLWIGFALTLYSTIVYFSLFLKKIKSPASRSDAG